MEQLTEGPERDFRPYWSPDGSRISFSRLSQDGKQADIYLMNADGSNQVNVTKSKDLAEYGSAWSPDGKRLITTVGGLTDTTGKSIEIETVGIDGSGRSRLTSNDVPDYDPVWSPRGDKIVYVSGNFERADLMVMQADGSNPRKLSREPATYSSPAWSPDGRRIVFSRGNFETPMLFTMAADGSREKELTAGREAVWSPDGKWIMFTEGVDLFVIAPDGSGRKQITVSGVVERFPSWSAEP